MGGIEPKYVGLQGVEALEVEEGIHKNEDDSPVGTFGVASSVPTATKVDNYENEPEISCVTVTWEKGEVQTSEYRDKGFAIAFIAHLVALMGLALSFGPVAWIHATDTSSGSNENGNDYHSQQEGDTTSDISDAAPKNFCYVAFTTALVVSPVLSFLALTVMSRYVFCGVPFQNKHDLSYCFTKKFLYSIAECLVAQKCYHAHQSITVGFGCSKRCCCCATLCNCPTLRWYHLRHLWCFSHLVR